MPATLQGLPTELLELALHPLLQQTGTIELQAPIWADKMVFVRPIFQVCKRLRSEAIRVFYHRNVFVWVIDPDEIRADSMLPNIRRDPTQYPLTDPDNSKDLGPCGSLGSPLPWYYVHLMQDLRHLRLNIFLPSTSDKKVWSTTFPTMLRRFASALEGGARVLDLKILVGTWHKPLLLREEHATAFDALAEMQIRGSVQVRTQGIFDDAKTAIRGLHLDKKMKQNGVQPHGSRPGAGGKYLDWDWEGGGILS